MPAAREQFSGAGATVHFDALRPPAVVRAVTDQSGVVVQLRPPTAADDAAAFLGSAAADAALAADKRKRQKYAGWRGWRA